MVRGGWQSARWEGSRPVPRTHRRGSRTLSPRQTGPRRWRQRARALAAARPPLGAPAAAPQGCRRTRRSQGRAAVGRPPTQGARGPAAPRPRQNPEPSAAVCRPDARLQVPPVVVVEERVRVGRALLEAVVCATLHQVWGGGGWWAGCWRRGCFGREVLRQGRWSRGRPGMRGGGSTPDTASAGAARTCRCGAYRVAPRAAGAYAGDVGVGVVQVEALGGERAVCARGWGWRVGGALTRHCAGRARVRLPPLQAARQRSLGLHAPGRGLAAEPRCPAAQPR